jgi:hypothetical protein
VCPGTCGLAYRHETYQGVEDCDYGEYIKYTALFNSNPLVALRREVALNSCVGEGKNGRNVL